MKVFLDTNLLLDVLAQRLPFYKASAQIWSLAESNQLEAFISAISFNNVYYVVRKREGKRKARNSISLLRDVFSIAPVDTRIIHQAIDSVMDDFEDAIQFYSAARIQASRLITRDPGHFPKDTVPIVSPEEFLAVWGEGTDPELTR